MPFKVVATNTTSDTGIPINSSVTEMLEEVLKPGSLYAECAVVQLKVSRPSEFLPSESRKKDKGKQGLEEVLEVPDDD
ncbi:hypothetical protein C0991_002978, partial [Blastosporella zonata]